MEKLNHTKFRWILKCVCIVCPVLPILFATSLLVQKQLTADPAQGQLYRNILILQDLDVGNVVAARQKLDDDSMVVILKMLEDVGYSTNTNMLCSQPGLRAAAKYWGAKGLPTNATTLSNYPVISNKIYSTLQIVKAGLKKIP